jgi:hypothetical protein
MNLLSLSHYLNQQLEKVTSCSSQLLQEGLTNVVQLDTTM